MVKDLSLKGSNIAVSDISCRPGSLAALFDHKNCRKKGWTAIGDRQVFAVLADVIGVGGEKNEE